jgi:histone H3/H4
MPKKKMPIPPASVLEVMKSAGAKRVSEDAVEYLTTLLIKIAREISKEAVKLAKHARRKTVMKEDVELAKERVLP